MPKDLDVILKNAYKKYEIDGIKCNTLNVSFFPIIRQIASVPVDFIGKSLVFLIGDTLATPHFFSGVGVNSGFRAGYFLGNLLGQTQDRKRIKQIYKREAKEIQDFLAKMSHQVTVNMDQVDGMCEKYNKKEIYQIARDNYLFPENMSKREVCLSIGRVIAKKK
jgi:flavin-dependent dehydrogenase